MRPNSSPTGLIHILGAGNVGCYLAVVLSSSASSLKAISSPAPSPCLLLRPSRFASIAAISSERPRQEVSLASSTALGRSSDHSDGGIVRTRYLSVAPAETTPDYLCPIHDLIVTTKATDTAAALKPLIPRLGRDSSILFLQNGMDVEKRALSAWPIERRDQLPRVLAGIISHGIYGSSDRSSVAKTAITLAGEGSMRIGPIGETHNDRTPALVKLLMDRGELHAEWLDPQALLKARLEKLVVNCAINPLTVIFDVKNGGLVAIPEAKRMMRAIVEEAVMVYMNCPGAASVNEWELERVWAHVQNVLSKVAENYSSMYQDWKAGKSTEIDYINGWVSSKAREVGLDVPVNDYVVQRIKDITEHR